MSRLPGREADGGLPVPVLSVFALGALVGTALDNLHVRGGVLAYPHPAFFGEAAWVPLLFGAAAVALVWNHRLLFRAAGERTSGGRFGLALLCFAAAYAATVALRDRPTIAFDVLFAAWLLEVRRSPRLALHGVGAALVGPLVEAALCRLGAFHYLAPGEIRGLAVPLWLPALYLHASVATAALDLALLAPPSDGALTARYLGDGGR